MLVSPLKSQVYTVCKFVVSNPTLDKLTVTAFEYALPPLYNFNDVFAGSAVLEDDFTTLAYIVFIFKSYGTIKFVSSIVKSIILACSNVEPPASGINSAFVLP